MTKYYVDAQGNYLGGFDGAEPPANAILVPLPPAHGADKWDGNAWIPHVPVPPAEAPKADKLVNLLVAKNIITEQERATLFQAEAKPEAEK